MSKTDQYVFKILNEIDDQTYNILLQLEQNSSGEPYSQDALKSILHHATNKTFICSTQDKIVGMITVNLQSKKYDGCNYIINLTVQKDYRRQGIATALFKQVAEFLITNAQSETIGLDVDKDNVGAINLYKKLGFEQYGLNNEQSEQYMFTTTVSNLSSYFGC